MFSAKLVFVTALSLSAFFDLVFTREVSRNVMASHTDCANCPTCQYPCPPSIPIPGYPLYGPPPPGPPPPSLVPGYPYGGPPPPSPAKQQGKCPPTQPGGRCCQYPQYLSPPGASGAYPQYLSPPGASGGYPQSLSPPGASGGYVPYPDHGNHTASISPVSVFLAVTMMLLSSAVFF